MTYLNVAQASLANAFGSVAVNGALALTLKAASLVGRSYVAIPSPSLTGAVVSGLTSGSAVVFTAYGTQSRPYGQLNAKLGLSSVMVRRMRNIVVFALPFFLTLFGVPWLASRMGQEVSYSSCGVFSALDLALFATHVSWKF